MKTKTIRIYDKDFRLLRKTIKKKRKETSAEYINRVIRNELLVL